MYMASWTCDSSFDHFSVRWRLVLNMQLTASPLIKIVRLAWWKLQHEALLHAGIRLLQAMGWRQGKGVGPSRAAPDSSSNSRWGKEAGIGAENVPIYALPPKTDTCGLGFDPFKVRPEPPESVMCIVSHGNRSVLQVASSLYGMESR